MLLEGLSKFKEKYLIGICNPRKSGLLQMLLITYFPGRNYMSSGVVDKN
jgi:hypothetical protein